MEFPDTTARVRNALELHHIRGNFHNDGMLMAYLQKERLLIQADAFHPRPGAKPYPTPPQFTVNLYENIRRLELGVARVLNPWRKRRTRGRPGWLPAPRPTPAARGA